MPKFRRVTGLFRAAIPDGADTDYTPELEALNVHIDFVPRFRDGVIAYPHLNPPEFVHPEPIQAVLQDGYVMTTVTVDEETTVQPVELMVSEDDEATQTWQWEAIFRDIRVGQWGDEIQIAPIRFTVPDEDGPLDLTEVVGESSGGTVTVKGPRGIGITNVSAKNGQIIIDWDDHRQVIPIPEAVPGPKGDGVPDGGEAGQLLWHAGDGARGGVLPELTTPSLVPNGGLDAGSAVGWPSEATYQTSDKPDGFPAAVTFPAAAQTPTLSGFGAWPVEPGDEVGFEVWVKADKPGSRIYFEVRDQAGKHMSYAWGGGVARRHYPVSNALVPTEWTLWRASTVVPDGATRMQLGTLYLNHMNGFVADAEISMTGLKLYRVGSLQTSIDRLEARIAALEA